jgi:hypothetical protein
LDISQINGAGAALLVGGDSEAVSFGCSLGYSAAENNAYFALRPFLAWLLFKQ